MKNKFFNVLVILVVVFGIYWAYSQDMLDKKPELVKEGSTFEITGTVKYVDTTQVATDGPSILLVESKGRVYTISVPTYFPCPAWENTIDGHDAKAGDVVSVKGIGIEGDIVPCDDPTHYFRVDK